jgi:proteasome lid subunit RPN8/RPN11
MGAAASACFPEECCGLLIGHAAGGVIRLTRLVIAANVAPANARRRRFEIAPAALFAVQRSLRERGRERAHEAGGAERLVGYFHSHPFGPLRPSAADLSGMHEAGLVAVIAVPERRTGAVSFGAWLRLGEGAARRFRPLALAGAG